MSRSPLVRASADEDLTLRKEQTDKGGEDGETCRSPEEGSPGYGCLWYESEIDDSSEEVSDCISLLEDTAGETSHFNRKVLERSRCGQPPDTTHADTEQRADSKELLERLHKTRTEFQNRDDD